MKLESKQQYQEAIQELEPLMEKAMIDDSMEPNDHQRMNELTDAIEEYEYNHILFL